MVGAFAQSRHCLASAVAVFLSMLVGCFASPACAADGADAPPPAVLIVHSNQRPTPAAVVIEDTLRGAIPAQLRRPVEVHSEYLDVEIPASATLVADQIAFLAHKYESRNVRAIIASAAGAVPFALRLREQMSSAVPIVHIAVPLDALPAMALPGNVVGKPVDLDPAATIKLALQLHPGVSRIVVVLGATERDRAWEKRIREAAARIVEAPDFEYIAGLPTDQILRRLEALTSGTVVYTPGYFTDGAGERVTPRRSVERIAQASAVPVYGSLDTFLDSGIVGGFVTPYEQQAREAAGLVVRLLDGATPASLDLSPVPQVAMVDWRQLRRWRVDEASLPAGTIVKFREPTLWDRYWREISVGIAVVLLQAGLIATLLVQRRTRDTMATALEESQKRMSLAARAARLSTLVWDVARDKVRATRLPRQPAGERAIAFEEVLESTHVADRDELQRAVNKALATGEEMDVEYRTVAADGEVYWIAARGRAEKGDGQLIGVAIDITERKRAELRALEDRNALRHMTRVSMLGQLSASIAHQLNQPLAAILGNAEAARKMLARERVDLVELREICDDIVTEDNRAAAVIRRLGALYKRGEMTMEPLDLNALIQETFDLLRAEFQIRHVTPIIDLAPELPLVDGESVQLQQVVLNLALNAADAMNRTKVEERHLVIRTEALAEEVRLFVIDNGSGIAIDHLINIFDAFWTTKPGGMGIGLAICQSIVAAHHGRITASNNPQAGATFCMTLPLKQRT